MPDDRPGSQPAELIRRLRAWSVSSWRHGDRIAVTRSACQRLADLTAERSGEPPRAVPDHGESALADQLAVLLADARAAGVPDGQLARLVSALADALGVRALS